MILLQSTPITTVDEARQALQMAIGVEFGTLPPYLYALYSIPPGQNAEAATRIRTVAIQEMIHMCLACNILNAIGGDPDLRVPLYPGPLPGDIGSEGHVLTIHLLPFSRDAMSQAMNIEEPEAGPIEFPEASLMAAESPAAVTIGEFYRRLETFLEGLPDAAWIEGRHQIDDGQYFLGQLFPVNGYADAKRAIDEIVSEGEGSKDSPLDFEHEVAHFYRFQEVFRNQLLTKADNPKGYAWTGNLGVDWDGVYPAIVDPALHDFSSDPVDARAAQAACDAAFGQLVQELQKAVTGQDGHLGAAVRAMFELRLAARRAFLTPLADPKEVAGPSFRFRSDSKPGASS